MEVVVVEHVRGHTQAAGGAERPRDLEQRIATRGDAHRDGVDQRTPGEAQIVVGRLQPVCPLRELERDHPAGAP